MNRFPLTGLVIVTAFAAMACMVHGQDEPVPSSTDELVLHVAYADGAVQLESNELAFRSLPDVQLHIRALIAQGLNQNVRVLIHGDCTLSEPLQFGIADSPPAGITVTYAVADANDSAVLSGGIKTGPWRELGDGVWVADLPVEELANGAAIASGGSPPAPVRQLFMGEGRLHRARSPNSGYFRIVAAGPDQRTALTVDPAEWLPPEQVAGIELAYLHDWSMSRVGVSSFDPSTNTLTLSNRIGAPHDFFRIGGFEEHARYFVENSHEFLDEEGEFFHDTAQEQLFVKLPANESPNESPIVVPRLEQLIRIMGTAEKPVRGLRFSGLQFRHTSCPIPATGYAGIQASFFERRASDSANPTQPDPVTESGHARVPAACTLSFAEDCQFEGCQFRQLGGGAIYLEQQTHHVTVTGCEIADVGGCGLMIGETLTRQDDQGQVLVCHDNVVRKCRVSRCGQILLGSVGIWVGIARDTRIGNNEVSDLPYSGISVGWRWDDGPSGCAANLITGNHIHQVMQVLSDGAGIYTLGLQPGTVLSGNRIHDIPLNAGRAESNGIFMDEGSTLILVEANSIYRTARSPIRFHKAGSNIVRGNQLYVDAGVEPFTFNNTDSKVITFKANETLDNSKSPESR